jgi:hypothetical protein
MWVLGQCRDKLLDATCFEVDDNKVLGGTVVKTVVIGVYDSNVRAMTVLDTLYTHKKNYTGKKAFEMPLA